MPNQASDGFTVTVEEGGTGIEPGDVCDGVIVNTDTRTWQPTDPNEDEVVYYDITIRERESGIEFNVGFPAGTVEHPRVTETTELGMMLHRFGQSLTIGEQFSLDGVFSDGTWVTFEVKEEDPDDPNNNYLDVEKHSVRPQGDAPEPQSTDTDTSNEEITEMVMEIVDEYIGEDETDLKKALLGESKDLFREYKALKEAGSVDVEDDTVFG